MINEKINQEPIQVPIQATPIQEPIQATPIQEPNQELIQNKQWYEYNITDRYNKIYKQFSLQDFWSWWSDNEDIYMELRITDFKLMREYAKIHKIPHSASGMYIHHGWQLEKIINYFKDKSTIWFGINPKRRLLNNYGYSAFSGLDVNISKIKFLFIDIDRVVKDGLASNEDLMNCEILSNLVLTEFGNAGFNNNYCKICSANGLQLLIKLDVPIDVPLPVLNDESNKYVEDVLFASVKNTLKEGIGKILTSFSNKYKKKYNVEIDSTGFNMGRVGALPYSFNFKYDVPIPRGIINIKSINPNDGFADYLRNVYLSKKIRSVESNKYKQQNQVQLLSQHKMLSNNLHKNVIIDLMTSHTFPDGGINNTLWYGIKILLHNSNIDTTDNEYLHIHTELKQIHNRSFSSNGLEPKFKGCYDGPIKSNNLNIVPSMINKYLRLHKIMKLNSSVLGYHKPIFSLAPYGKQPLDVQFEITPLMLRNSMLNKSDIYSLPLNKNDPLDDIKIISNDCNKIRNGLGMLEIYKTGEHTYNELGLIILKNKLIDLFKLFLLSFNKKWGNEITAYMMRYYMNDYLNYKRWKI